MKLCPNWHNTKWQKMWGGIEVVHEKYGWGFRFHIGEWDYYSKRSWPNKHMAHRAGRQWRKWLKIEEAAA